MSEVTRLEKVQPVSVTVYTGATAAKAQFAHTFRKRRRLSAFQRNCIAYQQEWKCAMCRNLLPPSFQIDHLVALQNGGLDHQSNLQCLCANCHAFKTAAENSTRRTSCALAEITLFATLLGF